jgi:hypothetical protein
MEKDIKIKSNYYTSMFFEKERCILFHSTALTFFSPLSSLYQITRLHNLENRVLFRNMRYLPHIFPQQVLMRYAQSHIATECKEHLNPLFAFGIIGILQGGIYGHSYLYFSKKLNITNTIKFSHYFKGPVFAMSRDIISQGAPFYLMKNIHVESSYYYPSLLGFSVVSTIISHPLHCMQILNQTNPNKNHYQIAKEAIKTYKWSLFYRGVESRLVLLFMTNLFNDIFLKNLWLN